MESSITTTAGDVWTRREHAELARAIYLRFGRNLTAARAGWERLFQNGCGMRDFVEILNVALEAHGDPLR